MQMRETKPGQSVIPTFCFHRLNRLWKWLKFLVKNWEGRNSFLFFIFILSRMKCHLSVDAIYAKRFYCTCAGNYGLNMTWKIGRERQKCISTFGRGRILAEVGKTSCSHIELEFSSFRPFGHTDRVTVIQVNE